MGYDNNLPTLLETGIEILIWFQICMRVIYPSASKILVFLAVPTYLSLGRLNADKEMRNACLDSID